MLEGVQGRWGLGRGGYETCLGSDIFLVWRHSNEYRLSEPDTDAARYGNGHGWQQEW